jgi:glutaredoxin
MKEKSKTNNDIFKIITKPGCEYCTRLKKMLEDSNKVYVEYHTNPEIEDQFTKKFGFYPRVPKTIYKGKFMNFDAVEKFLKNEKKKKSAAKKKKNYEKKPKFWPKSMSWPFYDGNGKEISILEIRKTHPETYILENGMKIRGDKKP